MNCLSGSKFNISSGILAAECRIVSVRTNSWRSCSAMLIYAQCPFNKSCVYATDKISLRF